MQFHGRTTGVSEYHIHALSLEGRYKDVGSFMAGPCSPWASGSGCLMDCVFIVEFNLKVINMSKCTFFQGETNEDTERYFVI